MVKLKNDLKNYILNEIYNKLDNYEGTSQYGCDWAYTLFENENCDGTYTYSTYEAKKWVQEYWDDIGEVVEELKFQFGGFESIPNVFDRPEAFMVMVIIETAQHMLAQCPYIDKRWNENFELTPYRIKRIKKELAENNDTWNIYD